MGGGFTAKAPRTQTPGVGPACHAGPVQLALLGAAPLKSLPKLAWIVGIEARKLMAAGHAGLKPPDAPHLATALVANADELHTSDDRLLDLDGKLTKLNLRICKPGPGGAELPLLKPLETPTKASAPIEEKAIKPAAAKPVPDEPLVAKEKPQGKSNEAKK